MERRNSVNRIAIALVVLFGAIAGYGWIGSANEEPESVGSFDSATHLPAGRGEPISIEGSSAQKEGIERMGGSLEYKLLLPALHEGSPVGTIRLVQRTPELDYRLSLGTFVGEPLLGSAVVQSKPLAGPEVNFILQAPNLDLSLAALIEAPGFSPVAVLLAEPLTTVELIEVDPVTVNVVNDSQSPIPGAVCWFMTGTGDAHSGDWIDGLNQMGFQAYGVTGDDGRTIFRSARLGIDNQVQVVPPGNLATQGAMGISQGQTITVVCELGFSVKGSVTSFASGAPLPGATVLAVGRTAEDYQPIGTAVVGEDGQYRFEGLPATYSSVFLEGEADGFAFQRLDLISPPAGDVREVSFELAPAVGAEFVVQTPWGEPIPGCGLSIREERNGLTIDGLESDEDGVVRVTRRLRGDMAYQVVFYVGDWIALGKETLLPGETETMTISRVARIDSMDFGPLPDSFKPETIHWYPGSSIRPGGQSWPIASPSPLVPSGPGYWVLESASGQRLGLVGAVPQGISDSLRLDVEIADLDFELPAGGPYSIVVSGADGDNLVEMDDAQEGVHSISVAPGVYELKVWGDKLDRDLTGIVVPPTGRDLGLLDGFELCGIDGRVIDAEGRGLPGLSVSAYGRGPFGVQHGVTDSIGEFDFPGMAPGAYLLVINGGDAFGTLVIDRCLPVFLRPGQWLGPLEIEAAIPGDNSEVTLAWDGAPEEGAAAWVVGIESSIVRLFSPTGQALLPSQTHEGHVYGIAFSPGLLMIQDGLYVPGEPRIELTKGQITNLVRIVDESGMPRHDISFHVEDSGKPFHYVGEADEHGFLEVTASMGLGIHVRLRNLGGSVHVYSLDDLLTQSEVVIPREKEVHRVLVTTLEGLPLRSAVALKFELGEFHYADGFGELRLPFNFEEAFFVEAPGYLGQWLTEPQPDPIALPLIVYDARFSPPAATIESFKEMAPGVRVTPLDLGEDTAFPEHVDFAWAEAFPMILPPLPEGGVRIQLLGGDGQELWSKDYRLRDHDQALD